MRPFVAVFLLLVASLEAFQAPRISRTAAASNTILFSDYLSGLGSFNGRTPSYAPAPAPPSWAPAPQPQQPYPSWAPAPAAPQPNFSVPFPSYAPPAAQPANSQLVLASGSTSQSVFQHATLEQFAISKLQRNGPRANADVGQPHDASLTMGQDGSIQSGSWWCAAGGWPSLKQRTTTEVFYVVKGQGCLTDMDGTRHYFGPGDTVILPKGWSGRWDVLEDIHKVWFVHDHPNIEYPPHEIIRVIVAHYRNYAPEYLEDYGPRSDAVHGRPETAGQQLYKVGPTEAGVWTCTPGSFPVTNRRTTECFHVLEGVFFLTNGDGTARRCGPGDTVILPKGWSGYWDVIETVKKLWVTV